MKYLTLLSIAITLGVTSCNKPEEQEFDREAMLTNIASGHILPEYQNLNTELAQLELLAGGFAGATSLENLNLLRDQFVTTYLCFQRVKMFDFGPAGDYTFKASTNTYPTDPDKINANIESGSYVLGSAGNTDAIGLPAIDYLLYSGADTDVLNRFSVDAHAENAKTYLLALIDKIRSELSLVKAEWDGAYYDTYIAANGTDVGSSISLLFNEWVKDIELLKNAKIGIPGGQFSGGETFPTYVEAYYSGISQQLALESVTALKRVYTGGTGVGFDDYMQFVEENEGTTVAAGEITNQFDVCHTKIAGLGNPFSEDIPVNFSGFEETFQEIKKLVAYVKTDVPAALGVLITFSDTDGD